MVKKMYGILASLFLIMMILSPIVNATTMASTANDKLKQQQFEAKQNVLNLGLTQKYITINTHCGPLVMPEKVYYSDKRDQLISNYINLSIQRNIEKSQIANNDIPINLMQFIIPSSKLVELNPLSLTTTSVTYPASGARWQERTSYNYNNILELCGTVQPVTRNNFNIIATPAYLEREIHLQQDWIEIICTANTGGTYSMGIAYFQTGSGFPDGSVALSVPNFRGNVNYCVLLQNGVYYINFWDLASGVGYATYIMDFSTPSNYIDYCTGSSEFSTDARLDINFFRAEVLFIDTRVYIMSNGQLKGYSPASYYSNLNNDELTRTDERYSYVYAKSYTQNGNVVSRLIISNPDPGHT